MVGGARSAAAARKLSTAYPTMCHHLGRMSDRRHGLTRTPADDAARRLVGRDALLEEFGDLITGASTSAERGVVFHGPPGVGKTRLAEELVALAAAAGCWTAFVRSRPNSIDLPLGVFAPIFPEGMDAASNVALLVRARAELLAAAAGRPIVLGVDDVHLLDATSAVFLEQLVSGGIATVVLTFRSNEWVPHAIGDLWHRGDLRLVPVDSLDRSATVAMAEGLLGAELDPDAAELVWRLTGGNPLFVRAVVLESGPAAPTREALEAVLGTSPSLSDFVATRLVGLDDAHRDALRVVALGEPLGLSTVEALVPDDVLASLEAHGYLEHGPDGDVRLAHPLFGEVLRRSTSRLAARAVYRRLAAAAIDRGVGPADVVRVAAWVVDGGSEASPRLLVDAAQRAMHSWDVSLSERLARKVWEEHGDIEAGVVLANVLDDSGDGDEVSDLLAELERRTVDRPERLMVVALQFRNAFWKQGDLDGARAALEAGEAAVADGQPAGEVRAWWSSFHALRAEFDRCREIVDELLAGPTGRSTMLAAFAGAFAEAGAGNPERVMAHVDRLEAELNAVGDQVALFSSEIPPVLRIPALLQLGRVADAVSAGETALATARSGGAPFPIGQCEYTLARALVWSGRPRAAAEHARHAPAIYRSTGHRTLERLALTNLAFAAAASGDVALAEASLARIGELEPHTIVLFDGLIWLARGDLAVAQHQPAHAVEHYGCGADWARATGIPFDEAALLHRQVALGRAGAVADRLAELADGRRGMYGLLADHARGVRDGDTDLLGRTAEAFNAAGAHGLAVRAASDTSEAAARSGDRRAATRWATRVYDWAASAENTVVATPSAVAIVPLSRREREVAEMAAAGLSSPDIAERLFLSSRTVENHLARAFTKLGVRNRSDLGAALGL